ncbi:hypothetical protein [Nocardioides sp. B-3]|uniref:hypothetical protein n=1 Tax=Nocardioides sp. B-3 TaxID=2895565 RepID=UPI002152C081|nr:hypothetical protein [Nocardioides sp. B-3]UUZ60850.1 hypothetical protein LP418_09010 [Nocardioides sp. B-3]
MVILGFLLVLAGAGAIAAALFASDPGTGAELLGFDISTIETFLLGVAAGAAILLGLSIIKWATKRSIAQRKERKELNKLSERLDRADSERRADDVPDEKI